MRLFHKFWQSGFSLVELTVAVAIFSAGIGSFSLLLLLALQGTIESRIQSIAISQVRSLTESIALTPTAEGNYTQASASPACLRGSACAPAQMAAATLYQWQRQLAHEIPGGHGIVCRDSSPADGGIHDARCDGAGNWVIKVFWTEPGGTGQEIQDRRVVARLPLL